MGCGASVHKSQQYDQYRSGCVPENKADPVKWFGKPGPVDVVVTTMAGAQLLQKSFAKGASVHEIRRAAMESRSCELTARINEQQFSKTVKPTCELLYNDSLVDDDSLMVGTQSTGAPVKLKCAFPDELDFLQVKHFRLLGEREFLQGIQITASPKVSQPIFVQIKDDDDMSLRLNPDVPGFNEDADVWLSDHGHRFWTVQSWSKKRHGGGDDIYWRLATSDGTICGWIIASDALFASGLGHMCLLKSAFRVVPGMPVPHAVLAIKQQNTESCSLGPRVQRQINPNECQVCRKQLGPSTVYCGECGTRRLGS